MLWHRSSATCCSIICCLIVLLAAAAVTADQNVVNSNCGTVDRNKVDDISKVEESSSTPSSITVGWVPVGYEFDFNYILECAGCKAGIVNTTEISHTFVNLASATAYNMAIRAELAGCNSSNTLHFVASTRLADLHGTVIITDVTETTLNASWMTSIDVGVTYEVSWDQQSKNVTSTSTVCDGLTSGSEVRVGVRAFKDGFQYPTQSILNTARTKLYAVDASSANISATASNISASWTASKTDGVSYNLTCSGAAGDRSVVTGDTNATCHPLESGQPYRVTVTVQKTGGYEDTVTSLRDHLTKLFPIDASSAQISVTASSISASWTASKTDGVTYNLTCSGAAGDKSVVTGDTNATCHPLESGQPYNVTVTVQKTGGYDDVATELGTHWIAELDPPRQLESSAINESCTEVTWSESLSSALRPRYRLLCQPAGGNAIDTGHLRRGTCCGLESGAEQLVMVSAHTDLLSSGPVGVLARTSMLPPATVNAAPLNDSCSQVTWSPSPSLRPAYVIRCPGAPPQYSKLMRYAVCCGLTPGVDEYSVSVIAVKSGHASSAAVTRAVKTYLKPPAQLHASPINETCLQVSWSACAPDTTGVSYRVRCPAEAAEDVASQPVDTRGSRAAVCCGLRPGSQYTVSVACFKPGFGATLEVAVAAATDLQPPQHVEASQLNQTCAQVTWMGSDNSGHASVTYRVQCPGAAGPVDTEGRVVAVCCGLRPGQAYQASVATSGVGFRDSLPVSVTVRV